jgi:hypothetical protein
MAPSVFVSLTVIRSRLHAFDSVINSLVNQTLSPDKIILHISRERYLIDDGMNFEDLPDATRQLIISGRVELYFTPNTGPYRKILPALERFGSGDFLLATADDDVLYPTRWLEGLYEAALDSQCICAYRCRMMSIENGKFAPYMSWPILFSQRGTAGSESVEGTAPSLLVCPTGRGGVIYHSRFFQDLDIIRQLQVLAPAQDDLALKFASLAARIPVRAVHFSKAGAAVWEFPSSRERGRALFEYNFGGRNDEVLQDILGYCIRKKLINPSDYNLSV